MKHQLRRIGLATFALPFLIGYAQAHEAPEAGSYAPESSHASKSSHSREEAGEEGIENEHIFGFADGSDIGAKGEKEIETTTVGSFGKPGIYANADNETSLRYSVTDKLRLSIGTITNYYGISEVTGLDNRHAVTFSGLVGEARVNILSSHKDAFGLSVSFNPEWRQYDPLSGARNDNTSLPVKILADKELIPGKLFSVVNLTYRPSFFQTINGPAREDAFTFVAGAAYAFTPDFFMGGEVRHENDYQLGVASHALYIGPNAFYHLTKDLSVKTAFAAQIPDAGTHSLDLSFYQRYQAELLLVYRF